MKRFLILLLGFFLGIAVAFAFTIWRAPKSIGTEAEREKQFEASMRGVTMVGHSTRLKHPGVMGNEERYSIDSLTKVAGHTWLFKARMKLGDSEMAVPMPVNIEWAGDTPVLTLTDVSVPGMGSYTVRIVYYGNQYAGTWAGKDEGGQMFGQIVR